MVVLIVLSEIHHSWAGKKLQVPWAIVIANIW